MAASTYILMVVVMAAAVLPGVLAAADYCYCNVGFGDGLQSVVSFEGNELDPRFTLPDGKARMEVTAVEYANASDPCRYKVKLGMRETSEGDLYLAYIRIYFGIHSKNVNKYYRQVKVGHNTTVYGEGRLSIQGGVQVSLPWRYADDNIEVYVNAMSVISPTCGYVVAFPGCTAEATDRGFTATISPMSLTPGLVCGSCGAP